MRKLSRQERCELWQANRQGVERHPIHVVLDNVRSLYNVGSIFRTSDAAGVEKLYLCGITPYPPDKRIEKTALGATQTVPWQYCGSAKAVVQQLKSQGMTITALELTDESLPYTALRPHHFPICLILGNEVSGVDDELLALCNFALMIPQFGSKESLNVVVAYGIVVFEMVRVYRQGQKGSS